MRVHVYAPCWSWRGEGIWRLELKVGYLSAVLHLSFKAVLRGSC